MKDEKKTKKEGPSSVFFCFHPSSFILSEPAPRSRDDPQAACGFAVPARNCKAASGSTGRPRSRDGAVMRTKRPWFRSHVLRTLLHKEVLRHLANRGGIALVLLLVVASLLLSVFGHAESPGGGLVG